METNSNKYQPLYDFGGVERSDYPPSYNLSGYTSYTPSGYTAYGQPVYSNYQPAVPTTYDGAVLPPVEAQPLPQPIVTPVVPEYVAANHRLQYNRERFKRLCLALSVSLLITSTIITIANLIR